MQSLEIIDCDVHVRWKSVDELASHMQEPFRTQLLSGRRSYTFHGYYNPGGVLRKDAYPPNGGAPGTDPQFTAQDLLDRYDINHCVLVGEPSQLGMSVMTDPYWAAALASAHNDWLLNHWFPADHRYLGSIFVAAQNPEAAAREIDRVGPHPRFVQVIMGAGTRIPYGQRFYHPIYEAAQRQGLPIAIHVGTEGAGISNPPTGAGYPNHYIEWHTLLANVMSAQLASFICEGVFEIFPRLRLVLVEGGLSWFPGLMWRLDKNWRGLRREVPWLKRRPSEYAFEHVRLTTQPIDEPDDVNHLKQLLAMFPASDMLLFSSDYPHWDFDNPRRVLSFLSPEEKRRIFGQNARQLYQL